MRLGFFLILLGETGKTFKLHVFYDEGYIPEQLTAYALYRSNHTKAALILQHIFQS